MAPSVQLVIFVHGMWGSDEDWTTWVRTLQSRLPEWRLRPLRSLHEDAQILGSGLDALAELAAKEIAAVVREEREQLPFGYSLTMHCIGHSMGGLIVRGALVPLQTELADEMPELGHYLSLSTPHLGVQASWLTSRAWMNLSIFTAPISSQLPQLAVQDGLGLKLPYLVRLSEPGSEALKLLGAFKQRTCVTLISGDDLVSLPSGIIDPGLKPRLSESFLDNASIYWTFDQHLGTDKASHFKAKVTELRLRRDEDEYGVQKRCRLVRCLEWVRRLCKVDTSKVNCPFGFTTPRSTSGLEPDTFSNDGFLITERTPRRLKVVGFNWRLRWRLSADRNCKYPKELLNGLKSVPWRRIAVITVAPPRAQNPHVFLMGKAGEQRLEEHYSSKECIECLVELLID